MTEKEFSGLIAQINKAFESQFARLTDLEAKVERLINEQQEGSAASAGRRKRVQQAKKNA